MIKTALNSARKTISVFPEILSGQLFAFLGGHFFRHKYDVDAAKVEAVGIETGIDGGIARSMGAGVKTDGFLECFELLV